MDVIHLHERAVTDVDVPSSFNKLRDESIAVVVTRLAAISKLPGAIEQPGDRTTAIGMIERNLLRAGYIKRKLVDCQLRPVAAHTKQHVKSAACSIAPQTLI